jgi:hypothetical protein
LLESTERRPDDIEQESTIEDEDGNKTVVKNVHRERQEGNTSATFSGVSRHHTSGDGSRTSSHTSTTTTVLTKGEPLNMARVGRSGSVRALQQRFQQSAGTSHCHAPLTVFSSNCMIDVPSKVIFRRCHAPLK